MLIDFRKHAKKQTTLHDEIGDLIGAIKKQKKERFDFWYLAVGEKIGKIAAPTFKKHGVLYVTVVNPVSRFELTRMKQEILEKVNGILDENKKLKDIIFK
ncbi:MAG TPA: DciA family protein [Ignavibacteria bacterium]|nr:DUF721 domain-containing protein [Ignavibacteria bacterium]HRE12114.1 DciA family protein [Ignavibacteria bacterium]HRF66596.1 DciA family protein [Ignavibacteria bacterium]HRJ03675.1 DciA family protein [Ignavibacteria bacterium]HRJ84782.1 DciA family protein [Ignavibacteria bacterium]